jgi:hypothetical protein
VTLSLWFREEGMQLQQMVVVQMVLMPQLVWMQLLRPLI